jgi:hypothetical protein
LGGSDTMRQPTKGRKPAQPGYLNKNYYQKPVGCMMMSLAQKYKQIQIQQPYSEHFSWLEHFKLRF